MSEKRITTLGKRHGVDDADLTFVYAHSRNTGGIFGLEMARASGAGVTAIEYDRGVSLYVAQTNLTKPIAPVRYAPAYGDGSSHGATWENLNAMVQDLTVSYEQLHRYDVERHVDALLAMAVEGNRDEDGPWEVIGQGMLDARTELLERDGQQYQLFKGLGYIAANFAERADYDIVLYHAESE